MHPQGQAEETVSKKEGISEQENEWSDNEGIGANGERILGEQAERYIRNSANIEDLPDDEEVQKAKQVEEENKRKNAAVQDDQKEEDEVPERKEDYVPGYDLGRNKVQ